ncbi:hypothetical protein ACHAXH_000388 [Discostella pseudostelligera]
MCADIGNAYPQAPSSEKHYIICGPKFGMENKGCIALIWRALYVGMTGIDLWHHLCHCCMSQLGFTLLCANPDVWFWVSKQTSGEEYYEYALLYIDDVLCVSERAEEVLCQEIGQQFVLKEESIGKLTQYLESHLRMAYLHWLLGQHSMFKLQSGTWKNTCRRKGRNWWLKHQHHF